MKNKVSYLAHNGDSVRGIDAELTVQLDQVKDQDLIFRSTLERRTMYRSMRMAEPRYVSSVERMTGADTSADFVGRLGRRKPGLVS